ncbi:hypothetical protein B484DRAFT_426687 [Ochromonadaceae sp. CCMP2298]|nr:hypothetical protein B484DRAFT_426687 [Ochromonadaceae sp. CCMP2298]
MHSARPLFAALYAVLLFSLWPARYAALFVALCAAQFGALRPALDGSLHRPLSQVRGLGPDHLRQEEEQTGRPLREPLLQPRNMRDHQQLQVLHRHRRRARVDRTQLLPPTGDVVNANDLHPWVECSNKGNCDRATGACQCFPGYDGTACQRTIYPNNYNDRGTCWPLASKPGRTYNVPWDAMKHVGCMCDKGYRGPACDLQECPSGTDPLDGCGNEVGRDCSGRGLCNYQSGTCTCFSGFYGTKCQYQTTIF